jgi:hypothetical protein
MPTPKYPQVQIQLSGQDGNIFGIIGRVTGAMKKAGLKTEAEELINEAFKCTSYDQTLKLIMSTVTVK